MSAVEETRLSPGEISFRVLGAAPGEVSPAAAARAVQEFLEREHPGLAATLTIEPADEAVLLRAEGESPDAMLREACQLLAPQTPSEEVGQIEVDVDEFAVETIEEPEAEPEWEETERLRSEVRYFPYPTCEWYEISTGDLVLTDTHIRFEPRWQITSESGTGPSGEHSHSISDVRRFWRGEWWDIPCLMLEMPERTYRYGWPAKRGEPETIFDVDEWLAMLRSMTERWE